jgi:hypothetical protein
MKQNVNPAVIVATVIVVVAVACFFGIRALFPPNAGSNLSPTDYRARMQQSSQAQQANMDKAKSHAPSGAPAGYQEYMKHRQGGGQ